MKKIILLVLLVIVSGTLWAFPPPPQRGSHPGPMGRKPRMPRNIWRAFAELSDAERKEMIAIQRNDPDKFREIMQQKALEIEKAERAERQQLMEFAKQYKEAKTDAEKELIRKQIQSLFRKRFNKRLESNRKQLEGMKRRAEFLEKELDKRAAHSEKIITLQTESLLSGKDPFAERHPEKRHPGKHNPSVTPQIK